MADKIKDIPSEQEIDLADEQSFEKIEEMLAQQREERLKSLRRHKLPAKLTLAEALNALTKSELEDIQYNLNLPMASNINRVKKADMVEAVLPEVVKFSKIWFVSIFEEQKELFDYACQHKGLLGELKTDDFRLDYLRGIGILYCGLSKGKLQWYMPKEIMDEYQKINNGAFQQLVTFNSEVVRLSAGLVFYYGMVDFDLLYSMVLEYVDDDLEFSEFIGILYNGGCWCKNIVVGQHELRNINVMNADALQQEQLKNDHLDYLELSYDVVWDAGEETYVESTPAYRTLAQFFMNKFSLDVLQSAEVLKSIHNLIQNGYGMNEVMLFLKDNNFVLTNMKETETLSGLIGRYRDTISMWALKGHTLTEVGIKPRSHLTLVRNERKIGRNDPCPCGSGKKYKNCCLDKNY